MEGQGPHLRDRVPLGPHCSGRARSRAGPGWRGKDSALRYNELCEESETGHSPDVAEDTFVAPLLGEGTGSSRSLLERGQGPCLRDRGLPGPHSSGSAHSRAGRSAGIRWDGNDGALRCNECIEGSEFDTDSNWSECEGSLAGGAESSRTAEPGEARSMLAFEGGEIE